MKKLIVHILFLSIAFFFSRCNSSNSAKSLAYEQAVQQSDAVSSEVEMNVASVEATSSPSTTLPVDKKIIRTGSISFESNDLNKSKSHIQQIVKQKNAYIESEDANAGSSYSSISLTIRIPSTGFDGFIADLENGEDKVTSKSIQANDVTAQYVDVESRLKSKRIYLERYRKLVATAKTTKDLLEIEEQIRSLQEEIDSYESTFRVLNNQIAYSTLTIAISNQQDRITAGPSFWVNLKDAFSDSWDILAGLFFGLIRVWPILLLIVIFIIAFGKWRRKRIVLRKNRNL
ncbi:DUF4349 domain-containing protein [Sphingobacterium hungaricum]